MRKAIPQTILAWLLLQDTKYFTFIAAEVLIWSVL